MSEASGQPTAGRTVAQVMRPPVTTANPNDHVAAAAYLMKHAGTTALLVLGPTAQPVGIITETDVANVVADGKNANEVRISEVMSPDPTVVAADTSIPEAARLMTSRHFRHLPVVDESGLAGIVDIGAVCNALLDSYDE